MRKKLLKKIIPALMVATLAMGTMSTGASAATGSFDFSFRYDGYDDSGVLSAAGPSVSDDHIKIRPTFYFNDTDTRSYLRVHGRTATDKGSATAWKKIFSKTDTPNALVRNYDSKRKYFLRGRVSDDATAGYGLIKGTWQTW